MPVWPFCCGVVVGGFRKSVAGAVGLPLVMGGAPGLWTTVVTIIILKRPCQQGEMGEQCNAMPRNRGGQRAGWLAKIETAAQTSARGCSRSVFRSWSGRDWSSSAPHELFSKHPPHSILHFRCLSSQLQQRDFTLESGLTYSPLEHTKLDAETTRATRKGIRQQAKFEDSASGRQCRSKPSRGRRKRIRAETVVAVAKLFQRRRAGLFAARQ